MEELDTTRCANGLQWRESSRGPAHAELVQLRGCEAAAAGPDRRSDLEDKVAALEAQQAALQEQRAALEAACGELGASRSRLNLIEMELQVGRAACQTRLPPARCQWRLVARRTPA